MPGEHLPPVAAQALFVEQLHHGFQEKEAGLFKEAPRALEGVGFVSQGQLGGAGNNDGHLGFPADNGLRRGGESPGAGPSLPSRT